LLPPPPAKDIGQYRGYLIAYENYVAQLKFMRDAFWSGTTSSRAQQEQRDAGAEDSDEEFFSTPKSAKAPTPKVSPAKAKRSPVKSSPLPADLVAYLTKLALSEGLDQVDVLTFPAFLRTMHPLIWAAGPRFQATPNLDGDPIVDWSGKFVKKFTTVNPRAALAQLLVYAVEWLEWTGNSSRPETPTPTAAPVVPPKSPLRAASTLPRQAKTAPVGSLLSKVESVPEPPGSVFQGLDPGASLSSKVPSVDNAGVAMLARRRAARRRRRAARAKRNLVARTEKAQAVSEYLSAKKEVLTYAAAVKKISKKVKEIKKTSKPLSSGAKPPVDAAKQTTGSAKGKGKESAEKSAAVAGNSRARRSARRAALVKNARLGSSVVKEAQEPPAK
jgi:hypothetical protein